MRFSDDRISHLSHLILDLLEEESCIEEGGKAAVLHDIKKTLLNYFKAEDQVDDIVRKKIRSYTRVIPEGSREWEIMYNKLFAEEMTKRGFEP